jgi:hypothetical protein
LGVGLTTLPCKKRKLLRSLKKKMRRSRPKLGCGAKERERERERGRHNYLTPWTKDILENLRVTQLVNKFSAFPGTRRFITVFTRVHLWSLS